MPGMETELLALSAAELTVAYETGELTPVDVVDATLSAAQRDTLNAFVALDRAGAKAAAQASEARWRAGAPLSRLDGVPTSIKDNIYVDGMPTRFGSLAIPDAETAGPDSPSVARLREAGAVIFGKTATPDYAHKIVTDSPLCGTTRNPCNPAHTPGGSSGGAAAAVMSSLGPIAIGTDGGGSIRIPAGWTGAFGLKPSLGRVPHHPRGAFAPVSHVGPITRTVADAARAMTILAQPDAQDWYALPPNGTDYEAALAAVRPAWRVAFSPKLGLNDLAIDPEVAAAVEKAARAFEALGAAVELVDPPGVADCNEVAGVYWVSLSALLTRKLGVRAGRLDPSLQALAEMESQLPPHAFIDASIRRGEIGGRLNRFFQTYDLLICPVIHCAAPRLADIDPFDPPRPTLTAWCNLTGLPAASVNCGQTRSGLPIGLQIVGGAWADLTVLQASFAFEQARGSLQGGI